MTRFSALLVAIFVGSTIFGHAALAQPAPEACDDQSEKQSVPVVCSALVTIVQGNEAMAKAEALNALEHALANGEEPSSMDWQLLLSPEDVNVAQDLTATFQKIHALRLLLKFGYLPNPDLKKALFGPTIPTFHTVAIHLISNAQLYNEETQKKFRYRATLDVLESDAKIAQERKEKGEVESAVESNKSQQPYLNLLRDAAGNTVNPFAVVDLAAINSDMKNEMDAYLEEVFKGAREKAGINNSECDVKSMIIDENTLTISCHFTGRMWQAGLTNKDSGHKDFRFKIDLVNMTIESPSPATLDFIGVVPPIDAGRVLGIVDRHYHPSQLSR